MDPSPPAYLLQDEIQKFELVLWILFGNYEYITIDQKYPVTESNADFPNICQNFFKIFPENFCKLSHFKSLLKFPVNVFLSLQIFSEIPL